MSEYITFALPKGRILEDSMELFGKIGITCTEMEEKNRKLVFENKEQKFRFMAVRATDVPTYVEYGCADIGVVGKVPCSNRTRISTNPSISTSVIAGWLWPNPRRCASTMIRPAGRTFGLPPNMADGSYEQSSDFFQKVEHDLYFLTLNSPSTFAFLHSYTMMGFKGGTI